MKNIFFFNYNLTFNKIGGEFFSVDRMKSLLEKNYYKTLYVNKFSLWEKKKIFNKNSILYFNGIFHGELFLVLIINFIYKLKIIISPKGELLTGALKIKNRKKKFFIYLVNFFLKKNVIFHCTSSYEKYQVKKLFKKNKILVARDMLNEDFNKIKSKSFTLIKKKFSKENLSKKKLRVVFYSTINRKKNLKFAIEIMSKLNRKVVFDIYGNTYQDRYLAECLSKTKNFNQNIKYNYFGEINNKDVLKVLTKYDIFLFPTLGENFGYVILEALMSGCFILISKNTTPWYFLQKFSLSKEIKLDNKIKWLHFLENFDITSYFSKTSIRNNYFYVINKHFNPSNIEKENLNLFKRL